jgi:hypothetical protein
MRPLCLAACCVLVLTCLTVAANPAAAITTKYTESFTTKQYCDQINTTAQWDTVAGELKLPRFQITLTGGCGTPGYSYGVAISGDYAYVADYDYGLQVVDITNPASPTLAGSCDTPGYAQGVAISGDHAYIADCDYGLQVIDITNPASPTLAGSYDTPSYAFGVAIAGDYAYVADGPGMGLQVVDITNPASPTLAGSCATPGGANGIAISGDYAYVAVSYQGLQVIDITNPASPTLAGICATPGYAYGVAISGDYAYVAAYDRGLQVVDITNPASPTLAGGYDTPGAACSVVISGDYAYVADIGTDLVVLDITNPASPTLAGSYDTPGVAVGVAIDGDHAYVADYVSGFQVLEVLQRRYDLESKVGCSLRLDDSGNTVEQVRLSAAQTDSIRWEVSADGGTNWQEMARDVWQALVHPGSDLRWRSTHTYAGGGINPACTYLEIEWSYVASSVDGSTGAEDFPTSFALKPSRPNPFSLNTSIGFDLPMGGAVGLRIFDARGRQVKTLVDQAYPAGRHSVGWGGDDDAGRPVGSGIYVVRMEAGDFRATSKVLLAR